MLGTAQLQIIKNVKSDNLSSHARCCDLKIAYHRAMLVSENRGQVAGKVELPRYPFYDQFLKNAVAALLVSFVCPSFDKSENLNM